MITDNDESAGRDSHNSSNSVIGNYTLQERLGGGEYSTTFRGVDKTTRDSFAIKIISKSVPNSKNLYDVERNAYISLKGLPGILQIKEDGENDESYYLVTEFIPDGSLREILKKHSKGMNIDDVINLFAQVAEAIDHIHKKNIIHRDLKPENILVRNTNEGHKIFIADFGVVKFTNDTQHFHTGNTAGTYWYIAPESWNADPKSPQSKAVDIYAFGVMLYEALEGKYPYEDINEVINNQPALPPTHTIQKAGILVAEFLLKAIHNDPEQRPTSAKEVINGIRNARDGNVSAEQRWGGRKVRNYKIEEVLPSSGRMGISLLASDTQTNRQVVLKAFTHSLSGNALQAYEKEKRSLDRLENGHGVLTPRDQFEHDGTFFIVTDYQIGGNLRNLLRRKPKLAANEVMEIFTQIAEAIDYIHDKKIIHRDIKPENIVYSFHEGKVIPFITDFGVAVILANTQSSFTTREIGTPRYMAPELWDPKGRGTKAVDIYAFGTMLYEALEGHAPFENDAPKRLSPTPVLSAERTFKELGLNAKNILLQSLARDAIERPKTATEIMQQIRGQHAMFLGKKYGKYTIEKFVGRGTYGATYRAYISKGQKRKFAFKVLTIPEPLMHEIDTLKRMGHHDGIASILDGGSENGIHYVVTDYLNGNNLRDMLQSYRQGMSLDEALKLFKPIAKAIDYLHDIGMVHGDIKPENVILCKNKNDENLIEPVITGFGISKLAGKVQPFHSSINFNYVAPELWKDGEPSPASDIYAFGIMLYETLEGVPPFTAKSLAGIMSQHLTNKPAVPKNLVQLLGKNGVNILLQSLDKNPEQRQKSANELISQLEDMAQTSVPESLGPIRSSLMRSLTPLINAGSKKIELSLSGLMGLVAIFIILFVFGLFILRGQLSPPLTVSTSVITEIQQPPTESASTQEPLPPPIGPPFADTPTPPPNGPTILECEPRYPLDQPGWPKDYKSESRISLETLYEQYYGKKRDNLDLYALAYYNNRKALEDTKYQLIDPRKLIIENGQIMFLPHQAWIDEYRKLPIPVLEKMTLDNRYSTINISGSSTLYPLSLQIENCFEKTLQSYQIQVKPGNTKSGLIDFCQSRIDIFGSSEEITPAMIGASGCPADTNFLKFEVARYAAVIFVSASNPYANELIELDSAELRKLLFSAELWSDVRDEWAGEPIVRYYPPIGGGVFEIVKDKTHPALDTNPTIANLNTIPEGNSLSQKVADNKFAIGFSSFSDYQNEKGNLTAIPIDNILPNLETIDVEDPTYPLTRVLYLYTGKATYDRNPLLRYFINYYLTNEIDFVSDLGYFLPNAKSFLSVEYYPKPSR